MRTLDGGAPRELLEHPVFDVRGNAVGRVVAIGTRHGELHRIGIERAGPEPGPLRFVPRERFTVERDRVILTP